jgi:hypothetical protein
MSERPIVNLCSFKLDLPTFILVSKVLVSLDPLDKCLYLGLFGSDYPSGVSPLCWICHIFEHSNLDKMPNMILVCQLIDFYQIFI